MKAKFPGFRMVGSEEEIEPFDQWVKKAGYKSPAGNSEPKNPQGEFAELISDEDIGKTIAQLLENGDIDGDYDLWRPCPVGEEDIHSPYVWKELGGLEIVQYKDIIVGKLVPDLDVAVVNKVCKKMLIDGGWVVVTGGTGLVHCGNEFTVAQALLAYMGSAAIYRKIWKPKLPRKLPGNKLYATELTIP